MFHHKVYNVLYIYIYIHMIICVYRCVGLFQAEATSRAVENMKVGSIYKSILKCIQKMFCFFRKSSSLVFFGWHYLYKGEEVRLSIS